MHRAQGAIVLPLRVVDLSSEIITIVVARDLVLHPPVAALTKAVVALNLATLQQVAAVAEGVTIHVLVLRRLTKGAVVAVLHLVPEYNAQMLPVEKVQPPTTTIKPV